MKILTGKFRGISLKLPEKLLFEPISTRIRTNLFNILIHQKSLSETTVLDLFAGSGILGWEAWSRGAKTVIFNDYDQKVIRNLHFNSEKFTHQSENIFYHDYRQALALFQAQKFKFDIIFLDPPFKDSNALKNSLKLIYQYRLLKSDGIVVVRTKSPQPCFSSSWKLGQVRRYGRHYLYFYFMSFQSSKKLQLKDRLLIILSGPSGVGKSQTIKQLLQDSRLNLAFSVSVTTRKPRNHDLNGRDYFFVDRTTFEKDIKEDNFLEHAKFLDQYYGTSTNYVQNLINQNKHVLFEIEIDGARQIKRQFPEAIWIFLFPPTFSELARRITNRGTETPLQITKRLKKSEQEIQDIKSKQLCDYWLINENLTETIAKIKEIIIKHLPSDET